MEGIKNIIVCEKCGHIAGWDPYFGGWVCTNVNCGHIKHLEMNNTGIELLKALSQKELNMAAALIFTVDTESIDLDQARLFFNLLKENFPDKQIIMMPKHINLHTVNEFEIRTLINTLYRVLAKINEAEPDLAENGYTC